MIIPVETYSKETVVFLDLEGSAYVSYSVRVRVKDRAGREAEPKELKFKPSKLDTNITNNNAGPLISNLRLEEFVEGIFSSAELTWATDEPSTTVAECAPQGEPATRVSTSSHYTTDHSITIRGLAPGKTYILRAISTDPFGNTALSEDLRVEIKDPFSNGSGEPGVSPSVEELGVVKINGKYALRWKTNKETAGVVELMRVLPSQILSIEPHYPGLAEPQFAGLEGCTYECHKGSVHKRVSHPTGRLPWKKAVRARDLPLLNENVMLCTTCHTPHGGMHSHILRKEKTELCSSCHR